MSFVVLYDTPRKPRPWWMAAGVAPVAAYQAKGAASLAASYVNLANPGTFNAAPGVAPTWAAATGWTFNGTTQYLVCPVVASGAYSFLISLSGHVEDGSGRIDAGFSDGGANRLNHQLNTGAGTWRYASGASSTDGAAQSEIARVVFAVTPGGGYRDGVAVGGALVNCQNAFSRTFFIAANNLLGAAAGFSAITVQSFVIFSIGLLAPQVAAQSAVMAAL